MYFSPAPGIMVSMGGAKEFFAHRLCSHPAAPTPAKLTTIPFLSPPRRKAY